MKGTPISEREALDRMRSTGKLVEIVKTFRTESGLRGSDFPRPAGSFIIRDEAGHYLVAILADRPEVPQ